MSIFANTKDHMLTVHHTNVILILKLSFFPQAIFKLKILLLLTPAGLAAVFCFCFFSLHIYFLCIHSCVIVPA